MKYHAIKNIPEDSDRAEILKGMIEQAFRPERLIARDDKQRY